MATAAKAPDYPDDAVIGEQLGGQRNHAFIGMRICPTNGHMAPLWIHQRGAIDVFAKQVVFVAFLLTCALKPKHSELVGSTHKSSDTFLNQRR